MDSELLGWVIRSALASTAAIVLVLAARPLCLRLLGARAALWPWLLVPLMMTAVSLPPPTETVVVSVAPAVVEQASADADVEAGLPAQIHAAAYAPATIAPTTSWQWPDLDQLMLAVWLLGALLFALHLLRAQRQFLRGLGTLSARGDGSYLAETSEIGPAVVGLLRPRIVLPADFDERYDERQRDLILAHERCHLARGDLAMNLLVCALRCLYWFNPLMHLAARHLRFDQELSCDAAVLRNHPNSRRDYADAILNTQLADLGLPVGCYWQSSHPLKWRIIMLTQPNAGRTRLILGAALVVAGSTLAAVSAWAALPARVVTEVADTPVIAADTAVAAGEAAPVEITVQAVQPGRAAPALSDSTTPAVAGSPVAEATPAVDAQPATRGRPAAAATPAAMRRPVPAAAPAAEPTPAAEPAPVVQPTPAPVAPAAPVPRAVPRPQSPSPPSPAGNAPLRPALASLSPTAATRMTMPGLLSAQPSASGGALAEIELPRMLKVSRPRFPRVGGRSLPKQGADVVVRVDLDEHGNASNLGIEHSELGRAFENAAIASVKRSEFAPARKNGAAVSCTALVTIRFQRNEPTDFSRLMDFPVTLRGHSPQRYSEPRYVNWRPRGG